MNSDNTLIALQKKECEMLKHLIKVCDQMNIKYYLLGGTLLGAVRHKGFIPWDDDIDVGMLREDYEFFTKNAQQYFPEHLFVQTFENDPGYSRNFAKLRDSNTTFIEKNNANAKFNQGVYIDIFPLDYYPDNFFSAKIVDIKKKYYMAKISETFDLSELNENGLKRIMRLIFRKMIPSVQYALEKRDEAYKTTKKSKRIANYEGYWGKKEIVPAEWFGEGSELEFEGMKVRGVKEYDLYLTQLYGDYMKLPPVEKRVTHHDTYVIDLDHSYKNYLK